MRSGIRTDCSIAPWSPTRTAKVTEVSNSIIQERYITVSVSARDIEEARSYFIRTNAELSYDLEQQRKETKEYLDDLTNRDQRMMFALVTMVLSADSKEQLERDTKMLRSIAGKHLCQLSVLKYQQMDGLNTALPYGLRRVNAMRTLTTESTAILMPFRAHEIMEPGGTYCGMNAISNNLIIANRKNLLNGKLEFVNTYYHKDIYLKFSFVFPNIL